MDRKMIEDIRKNWTDKSSEEMIQIWKENDHERWSDSAFEAVKQILTERGVELPAQNIPKETEIPTDKKKINDKLFKNPESITGFVGLIILLVGLYVIWSSQKISDDNTRLIQFGVGFVICAVLAPAAGALILWLTKRSHK